MPPSLGLPSRRPWPGRRRISALEARWRGRTVSAGLIVFLLLCSLLSPVCSFEEATTNNASGPGVGGSILPLLGSTPCIASDGLPFPMGLLCERSVHLRGAPVGVPSGAGAGRSYFPSFRFGPSVCLAKAGLGWRSLAIADLVEPCHLLVWWGRDWMQ